MFGSLAAQLVDNLLCARTGEKLAGFIGNVRLAAQLLYLLPLLIRHGILVSVQGHRRLLLCRTTPHRQDRSCDMSPRLISQAPYIALSQRNGFQPVTAIVAPDT